MKTNESLLELTDFLAWSIQNDWHNIGIIKLFAKFPKEINTGKPLLLKIILNYFFHFNCPQLVNGGTRSLEHGHRERNVPYSNLSPVQLFPKKETI